MTKLRPALLSVAAATLALSGCAQMQMGSDPAKTVATGSTAGSTAQKANRALERCDTPLGTLTVNEDSAAAWYGYLGSRLRLGSTVPVLRLIVQQSNCFVLVDRGRGLDSAMKERSLRDTGELRAESAFDRGQLVAADYVMSPSITFSNNDAGALRAGVDRYLPGVLGGVLGTTLAKLDVKEASTLLTLVDNRSGVQLAAAEGSARNLDLGLDFGLHGLTRATAGGYTDTAEGKVLVAAFTDSFNGMVRALRQYRAQTMPGGLGTGGRMGVQGGGTPASQGVAPASPAASSALPADTAVPASTPAVSTGRVRRRG